MNPLHFRAAACLGAAITLAAVGITSAGATTHPGSKSARTTALKAQQLRIYNSDAWILKVDVRKYRFGVVTAHDGIDTVRETIPSMSRRTHALAGMNTDAFYWTDSTPPRGGVVSDSVRLKLQNSKHQANLYFTSDGKAHVGPTPYTLTVNGRAVSAFNSVLAISQRRLTELTPAQATTRLPRGCKVITLKPAKRGKYTVVSTKATRTFTQLHKANNRALVACSAPDVAWAKKRLPNHAAVSLKFRWQMPSLGKTHITTLTSGVAVLVDNGKKAHDRTREFRPTGRNPETFACVSRDGLQLTLGVIDGWSWTSDGLSFDQLRSYMLKQSCWDGIVFDGGGSTNMVVRNKTLNQPSDGQPRPVPVGLFVYAKPTSAH